MWVLIAYWHSDDVFALLALSSVSPSKMGFSVHLYLNSSILSSGECVQERKTVVFFGFDGELYVRVDGDKLGMKFLYMFL